MKFKLLTLALLAGLINGCSEKNQYAEPPPPKVTVAEPLVQEVTDYLEFTGTTEALETVEVRARVKGFLQSVNFTAGSRVNQGDLLFVIDPQEYVAELNATKAELASAHAELKRAKTETDRAQRLFRQKAGSESDMVKWQGEQGIAEAAILRAEAKIVEAELNLSYTEMASPIDGRVSRNLVDPGNLVGNNEATLITTVIDYDPIYAYFNLNERDLLMAMELYKAQVKKQGLEHNENALQKAEIPLFLGLANEEGYPHEGVLDYADTAVDTETGTLQMRGVFENGKNPPDLIPGLFARLRMPIQVRADALLVSERAVGADQGGQYLLLVNQQDQVEKRLIRTGQLVDGLRVIEEGLKPGERVIVKGLQRSRPGATVAVETVDMASLTTSALRQTAEKAQQAATSGDKSTAGTDTATAPRENAPTDKKAAQKP